MSYQQKTYMKTLSAVLLSAALLGGCASSNAPTTQVVVGAASLDKPLYLIGSFNWWEVDEQYVLTKTGKDTYSTQVELIADGQPYDFIIADAKWSPGYTCGYHNKNNDQVLELGKVAKTDCTARTNNFQFKPQKNSLYEVEINLSNTTPQVVIRM